MHESIGDLAQVVRSVLPGNLSLIFFSPISPVLEHATLQHIVDLFALVVGEGQRSEWTRRWS